MQHLIDKLKTIPTFHLTWIFILAAIVFSEIIVVIISFLVLGRLDNLLLFAGFATPLIDAAVLLTIFSALIEQLKKTEHSLRESRDLAQAANRTKSVFLANMSHEIRTPLNAVIGMTDLLLDTPLTTEQQEYGQTVRSSGDTLLTLINDILDFSKIEAGKLDLEMHPFDLRLCVEEALDVLAPRASEKELEIAYQIDPELPAALIGDITRLRQVLVNLIGNAVKFTEKGEVVVSVTGKRITNNSTHSQHEIQFSVKDTGIGISKSGIDKLFKSFSQVDASTTRRFGGTGLGLAVSKRLVEMMSGAIWVESEAGSGSTFHFTVLAEATASPKQISFNQIQPSLSGKRLLIVDDNKTNRHILLQQTKRWGMIPETAVSGPEALSWLDKGQRYDIVILDFQMPEMDGLVLANEICDRKNGQSPPLVMLSSVGQLKNKAYSKSIDAFLTKPVKPAQLFDILMKQFAGQPLSPTQSLPSVQIDTQIAKRHPLRILLAEDNVINQKVALRMLERIGYRADIANNGLEVIDALQRQAYDLIFMDVQMPEMDGVEATAQIRQSLPEEQQPQIVALTADALTGAREHYVAAGMDDYISKPFRMEQLISILDKS